MIVVTYQIMQFFGPFDIELTDICGSSEQHQVLNQRIKKNNE